MKVSWQVTGIRQDAYANAHRIQVEKDKSTEERGKYLHPMEHGKPETLGINYEEELNGTRIDLPHFSNVAPGFKSDN